MTDQKQKTEALASEIAVLARALMNQEARTEILSQRVRWLRELIHFLMSGTPWYWKLLLPSFRRKRELLRLVQVGLFDAEAYVRTYPDVHLSGQDPLRHYLLHGMDENRKLDAVKKGFPARRDYKAEIACLAESGDFNENWYLQNYPDVDLTGMDPAEHFLRIGKMLGRRAASTKPDSETATLPAARKINTQIIRPHQSVDTSSELREQVRKSRLFDNAWYRTQYGSAIDTSVDLLDDYLATMDLHPYRDPGPLFSTAHYLNVHPDVREMHPFLHWIEYGLREGRAAFSAEKANRFLQDVDLGSLTAISELLDTNKPTTVLHWADGNFFFADIAKYTCFYLNELGFRAECGSDLPAEDMSNRNVLIVAPHEFCVHGPGATWTESLLKRATYINTEQWHTSWFTLTYRFVALSGKVVDINAGSAGGFAKLGFRAAFLPLLPLEGTCFRNKREGLSGQLLRRKAIKTLTYPECFAERPYDVLFLGVLNERRSKVLASLAPVLSSVQPFLHCPKFDGPIQANDPDMISNCDVAQLGRNSKILLNIHQGGSHYFEWHRLFLTGIMEGCVVLTEPCAAGVIAVSGKHYLEADVGEMPKLLDRLLHTGNGRATLEKIHSNCLELRKRVDAGERFTTL